MNYSNEPVLNRARTDTAELESARTAIAGLKRCTESTLNNLIAGFKGAKVFLNGMRDREKEIDNIISDLEDLKYSLAELDDACKILNNEILNNMII